MIVELRLTPRIVSDIRRRTGYFCHWFAAAHAAMKRHRLLYPRERAWERWLVRYKKRRHAATLMLRSNAGNVGQSAASVADDPKASKTKKALNERTVPAGLSVMLGHARTLRRSRAGRTKDRVRVIR